MSNLVQITKDQNNREMVMVRVDKTLKELMEEKPSSRWNASYWHPKYEQLISELSNKFEAKFLSEFKELLTSGFRGTLKFTSSGIPALKVRNVLDTGLDLINIDFLPQDSSANTENKVAKSGDIIINRSGTGSIGRMSVFLGNKITLITGDVYLLRVKNISPFYVNIYLKTKYGKEQIHRFEAGVSGQTKIDLEEVLNILIPVLPEAIQNNIEKQYIGISSYHESVLNPKTKQNSGKYKNNFETAESMLEDLISKTESVIRGEREDIV